MVLFEKENEEEALETKLCQFIGLFLSSSYFSLLSFSRTGRACCATRGLEDRYAPEKPPLAQRTQNCTFF